MAEANPFDEFDANPFDAFDEDPKAEKKRKVLSAGERFMLGVRMPLDGGHQLATRANKFLSDKTGGFIPRLKDDGSKEIAERKARYEAGKPEGIDWANMAGQIVSPPNLAMMLLPGGGVAKAASLGATSGALAPADEGEGFWSEKAQQAAVGAAGGAAGTVAARTVGRALSPNAAQNGQLQLLKREGVRPTIGQAMGGRWNVAEERLGSLPFIGDAIALARDRGRTSFNRAAINRVTDALPPGTARAGAVGHEGVAAAGDRVRDVYGQADALLNTPHAPRPDRAGLRQVQDIIRRAQQGGLPAQHLDTLRQVLNTAGTDITRLGSVRDFKRLDSYLGERSKHFTGSSDAYQRDLGTAIGDIQRALRESVMRKRPQASVLNTMADDAYGNLVRVENAATKGGMTNGTFTPGQLLASVKQGDPRIRHRGFARGEARMQDLASAGQSVLGNKVPDSGTGPRLLTSMAAAGAGGLLLDPSIAATTAAGMAAYTPVVQRLLVAAASTRPGVAARARAELARIAPHLAVPSAVGAGAFFGDE